MEIELEEYRIKVEDNEEMRDFINQFNALFVFLKLLNFNMSTPWSSAHVEKKGGHVVIEISDTNLLAFPKKSHFNCIFYVHENLKLKGFGLVNHSDKNLLSYEIVEYKSFLNKINDFINISA